MINDYLRHLSEPQEFDRITWKQVIARADILFNELRAKIGGSARALTVDDQSEHTFEDQSDANLPPEKTDNADQQAPAQFFEVLTEADRERMKAICLYCAKDAANQKGVIQFRTHCLNGRFLTLDQYSQMVNSPGLGFFTVKELQNHGVSLTSASEVTNYQDHPEGDCTCTVRFKDPDISVTETKRGRDFFAIGMGSGGNTISISRVHGSVLRWLETLGDALAKQYEWNKVDAYIFLVTGTPPGNLKVESSRNNLILMTSPWTSGIYPPSIPGMVRLQVPCWLSSRQVVALYQDITGAKYKGPDGKVVNPPAGRPPDAKSIRLFSFVEDQRDILGIKGVWTPSQKKTIFNRWNEYCILEGHEEDQEKALNRFFGKFSRASKQYRKQLTGWGHEEKEDYDQWNEKFSADAKNKPPG